MKFPCMLLLIAITLIPWSPVQAEAPLRIGTEGAYPPFNDIDQNGKLTGFDVDIAFALCYAMGRECTIEAIAWDDLLTALEEGKIDAIVASMARTPEREKTALFTNFYYRSRAAFVGNPAKDFVQTRQGLQGKTIATQTNTVQEQYLRRNFEGAATIVTTKTIGESFTLLAKGQVDCVLSDSLTNYNFLQTEEGKEFDFVGTPLPANSQSSEARIAVRKDDNELARQFNQALKDIRLSGAYNKINRKYFPFSIY